jgi:hypothetical protein
MLSTEKTNLFKKRVMNGQSLKMIMWEFKLSEKQVKSLCKDHSLILNVKDELRYVNKLDSNSITGKIKYG